MKTVEIRCKNCGKLLGDFEGKGTVKCTRTECGGMNIFETSTGKHEFIPKRKPSYLKNRATSSGVTFNR
ncbi:hypothetical protein [Faecalicatena contorta]|uniref:hypothetical protein n=1 Tax=Faecalicatena contorta TaxID=39482 RepID=UPI0012DBCD55|nr:hypothetical protein [Muricomes sp.]